jgi:hypothetical protein
MATGTNSRIAPVKTWVGATAPALPPAGAALAPAPRAPRWPAARLAAVEALWGEGFTSPGGAALVLRLSSSLALSGGDKLLLLGGGLGGPAFAIAEDCGAWVSSFEADGELAALARRRTSLHGCRDRIRVAGWDPDHPDFGLRASHHAVSLEALRGADPVATLNSLAGSLRSPQTAGRSSGQSQIVMTEMVADRHVPDSDREFSAWCRLENRQPVLPRGQDITAALTRLGYDVRVVEDISGTHVNEALTGWRKAVRTMEAGPSPSAAAAGAVVTEAELWLLRIRVMRRLGFRLLRWHAVSMR